MAKQQIELAIHNYLRILEKHRINVRHAILYGSHAAGTATEDSDIDLALISEDFGQNHFEEAVRLKMLTINVNEDISPRPYSLTAYRTAKRGDFLFDEIIQKGQLIR